MPTIKELIAELSAIENQDQPIMYEYYLAEQFEFADGTPSPTPEQFGKIIDSLDPTMFSEVYSELNDIVYYAMVNTKCDQCDEPCSKQEIENHNGLCMDCNELYGEETNA